MKEVRSTSAFRKMFYKPFFLSLLFILFSNIVVGQQVEDSLTNRSDSIIHEVKLFASKNNFVSKILRNFLVIERKSTPNNNKTTSNKLYNRFEGRIIRKIDIEVLDVFGKSINNKTKQEKSWLEKAGNNVHKNTREFVIRRRLIFKKGDLLDPLEISESERILRSYKNTYDARVYVKRIPGSRDSVDVKVEVQDVWSITGSGALNPNISQGDLSLKDVNFLGLGNELNGHVYYNKRDTINWHYTIEYISYNIANTFITGSLYYKNLPLSSNYGAGLNREFFSPSIKWAGGLNINWLISKEYIYDNDSNVVIKGHNKNQQDIWLGRGFDPFSKKKENKYFVGARILRTNFTKNPSSDTFRISFQNSTLALASIGYSYRRFIKENYIFGLGRTEDIPVGKTISLTVGYERGQFYNRPYFGAKAGFGEYFDKVGYFGAIVEWGSFRSLNHWQDEVISGELLFYSKLISLGTWRWRNFFWNRITYGYNTSPGRILYINKREGLRGFSSGLANGNKKYVINYESVLYTPFNLLGFRTAFMFFADFAKIGDNSQALLKGNFYQAYGIGFRFRNEHLIFRTIQITFAYYPRVREINEQEFKFFEESRAFYQFSNFQFIEPRPVQL